MDKNDHRGLLEKSLALLPGDEKERDKDETNKFIEEYSRFNQRRKEIMSQSSLIVLEFLEGNISSGYVSQEYKTLTIDMDRTFYDEIRCSFDFLQKIFGFERTEEILRDLYCRAQIDLSPTFKKSGLDEQEINGRYDKILNYLNLVFRENLFQVLVND